MWLILALWLLAIVLVLYLDTRKPKNFPPGPRWLPIIGCALKLRRLHQIQGSMSKALQALALMYGPVVGARVGRKNIVFVCGVQALQEVLLKNELNGRPNDISATSRTGGTRKGILFTDSELWQEQRKVVVRHFKEVVFRKEVLEGVINQEVYSIINDIKRRLTINPVVDLNRLMANHVLSTICFSMTGHRSSYEDKEVKELEIALTNHSQNISMSGPLFTRFPFVRHILPEYCGYNMYVNIHKKIIDFFQERVKIIKEAGETTGNNIGLIYAYLEILSSDCADGNFSEEQLAAICLDLSVAGFDATCNCLQFALFYMLIHPEVQKKAQNEIDSVVKGRLPSLEDKPRLPYVECITLESLRLFAGRSLFVPRRATKDAVLSGYFIPKDTIILANIRGFHLEHIAGWSNPKDFVPERFLKDGAVYNPNNFYPFGMGKRRCVAEIMARANLFVIIASLLQTFNFETVPENPKTVQVVESFTPSLRPYKAYVTLR